MKNNPFHLYTPLAVGQARNCRLNRGLQRVPRPPGREKDARGAKKSYRCRVSAFTTTNESGRAEG